nr:protein SPIRRIG-like [Ipomoea batatas]
MPTYEIFTWLLSTKAQVNEVIEVQEILMILWVSQYKNLGYQFCSFSDIAQKKTKFAPLQIYISLCFTSDLENRGKPELELDFKRYWEEFHSSSSEKEKEKALIMTVDAFCKLVKNQADACDFEAGSEMISRGLKAPLFLQDLRQK